MMYAYAAYIFIQTKTESKHEAPGARRDGASAAKATASALSFGWASRSQFTSA